MRCPKCSLDNTPGKIICARCGTRLRPAAAGAGGGAGPQSNPELFMRHLRADLIRLGIVILVVATGAVLLGMFVP